MFLKLHPKTVHLRKTPADCIEWSDSIFQYSRSRLLRCPCASNLFSGSFVYGIEELCSPENAPRVLASTPSCSSAGARRCKTNSICFHKTKTFVLALLRSLSILLFAYFLFLANFFYIFYFCKRYDAAMTALYAEQWFHTLRSQRAPSYKSLRNAVLWSTLLPAVLFVPDLLSSDRSVSSLISRAAPEAQKVKLFIHLI